MLFRRHLKKSQSQTYSPLLFLLAHIVKSGQLNLLPGFGATAQTATPSLPTPSPAANVRPNLSQTLEINPENPSLQKQRATDVPQNENPQNHGDGKPARTNASAPSEGRKEVGGKPATASSLIPHVQRKVANQGDITTYVEASDHATHVLARCELSLTQITPLCESWRVTSLEGYRDAIGTLSKSSAYSFAADPMALHISTGGWIQNTFYAARNARVLMFGDSHGAHPAGRANVSNIEVHPVGKVSNRHDFRCLLNKNPHPRNTRTSSGDGTAPLGESPNPSVGMSSEGQSNGQTTNSKKPGSSAGSCKPPADGPVDTNRRPPPSGGPPSGGPPADGHSSSVSSQPGAASSTPPSSSGKPPSSSSTPPSSSGTPPSSRSTPPSSGSTTSSSSGRPPPSSISSKHGDAMPRPLALQGNAHMSMDIGRSGFRTAVNPSSDTAAEPAPTTPQRLGLSTLCNVALGAASQRRNHLVGGTVVPTEDLEAANMPLTGTNGEGGDIQGHLTRKLTRKYVRLLHYFMFHVFFPKPLISVHGFSGSPKNA